MCVCVCVCPKAERQEQGINAGTAPLTSTCPVVQHCHHIQDYIIDAEELSLSSFIKKYQDDLPLHVRVCKGFYGQSERTSVSEGDTFNVHFIKKAQVSLCD